MEKWEDRFNERFSILESSRKSKSGCLLPIIPDRSDWEEFICTVKDFWPEWYQDLPRFPFSLLVLFGGLAYFEYNDNTFWPQFATSINKKDITENVNVQRVLNSAFSKCAKKFGLKIIRHEKRTDFVGSAVYHIGIPLSLWDEFLSICDWARCHPDWDNLTDSEWSNSVKRVVGSKPRLKRFLIENRESAKECIKEMLDIKVILENKELSIEELEEITILRSEYFEEVPETAEFLQEKDPDLLFKNRAKLYWDEQRNRISIHLPAIPSEHLPALWQISHVSKKASTTPDEITLNSKAFNNSLLLTLKQIESNGTLKKQRLPGIQPWGLFDLESRRSVNIERQQLPIRSYAILSNEKLENIIRKGFDEEENPVNEIYTLEDGRNCYVTRLWPTGKSAKLEVKYNARKWGIKFLSRTKIEARIFIGKGNEAIKFAHIDDKLKIEHLPIICVAIPEGYFEDNNSILNNKFVVKMDELPAAGMWVKKEIDINDTREFYFWNWSKKPFLKKTSSGITSSFKDLPKFFQKKPILKKDRTLIIQAKDFGIKFEYKLYIDDSIYELKDCWKNLPGAFLPWVLLSQYHPPLTGMKWDDLMLAKDVIAPKQKLSSYILRKYANCGLIEQRGSMWMISESRVVIKKLTKDKIELKYCGEPSIMWKLYRKMYHCALTSPLPQIEVLYKRGQLPFLKMEWLINDKKIIENYLEKSGVKIVSNLWDG